MQRQSSTARSGQALDQLLDFGLGEVRVIELKRYETAPQAILVAAMPVLQNSRYELFCQHLVSGKSMSEAYVLAGYKANDANAHALAHRPAVAERIQELKSYGAIRAEVTVARVLAEMARIAFADITEAVSIVDGQVHIKDTDALPADFRAAIAEVRRGREGVVIKMHSKIAALEGLARHLGMFKENVDLNMNVSLADLVNGSFRLERGEATAITAPVLELEVDATRNTAETPREG